MSISVAHKHDTAADLVRFLIPYFVKRLSTGGVVAGPSSAGGAGFDITSLLLLNDLPSGISEVRSLRLPISASRFYTDSCALQCHFCSRANSLRQPIEMIPAQ
jgi:hypothetical protein